MRPDDGSHPNETANRSCSSSPNQNVGSEIPAIVSVVTLLSRMLRCRAAASTPIGSAATKARMSEATMSSIVAGIRSARRTVTGRPSENEKPQSPMHEPLEPRQVLHRERTVEP